MVMKIMKELSTTSIRVKDVDGKEREAFVSRFSGFPEKGHCGWRVEWQPGILHAVKISNMEAHYHDDLEELFLVIEGSGTIYVGGTPIHVGLWDTVRVPKHTLHVAEPDEGKDLIVAIFFKRW
jgi:mannose-6-phosphate isomerase-like protein (cupin superfamily)